jgi:ABC-type multidrug transport system permease subunit
MSKLKRIRVFSLAKLQAVIMAIVGLIAGILYSFGGAIYDVLVSTKVLSSSTTPGVGYGTALAFLALIIMPIMFATFGFIVGLIEAFLYNLFARWFGGIEIDFEQ